MSCSQLEIQFLRARFRLLGEVPERYFVQLMPAQLGLQSTRLALQRVMLSIAHSQLIRTTPIGCMLHKEIQVELKLSMSREIKARHGILFTPDSLMKSHQ